ncbi:hypothetical protein C8Q77DRAFT_1120688, partial [Trametes polyzona]
PPPPPAHPTRPRTTAALLIFLCEQCYARRFHASGLRELLPQPCQGYPRLSRSGRRRQVGTGPHCRRQRLNILSGHVGGTKEGAQAANEELVPERSGC